jgi:hypothetical protein
MPNSVWARPIAAAALLVTATAAAADILVVRSLGPSAKSFPPGKRLPESARISLKAGDQLVVLDGRGTRTIRGPGTFAAGAAAPVQTASTTPVTRGRARIGAVRTAAAGELRPPTIWHVDVDQSSNICVADPAKLMLWRADPANPVTLSITGAAGRTRKLLWPNGSSTLPWPADLPATEGSQYRLSWTGGAVPSTIHFRSMPAKPAGLEDTAQSLIQRDCQAQLDLLIETVKLPETRKPAG